MTVAELAKRLNSLDIDKLVIEAIESNAEAITELNRSQMREGKTALGADIAPYYRSFTYADLKKASGSKAPFGIPDLKLTGAFQSKMRMRITSKSYSFESTDEKATKLADKYSDIYGLTDENKEIAKAMNTKTLGELFKKATGLK